MICTQQFPVQFPVHLHVFPSVSHEAPSMHTDPSTHFAAWTGVSEKLRENKAIASPKSSFFMAT